MRKFLLNRVYLSTKNSKTKYKIRIKLYICFIQGILKQSQNIIQQNTFLCQIFYLLESNLSRQLFNLGTWGLTI